MRVLCNADKNKGILEVIEIIDIVYDDDIKDIKDDKGEYDRFSKKRITGLLLQDFNNEYFYIEGITLLECNEICEKIVETGYYNLSSYGEYQYL